MSNEQFEIWIGSKMGEPGGPGIVSTYRKCWAYLNDLKQQMVSEQDFTTASCLREIERSMFCKQVARPGDNIPGPAVVTYNQKYPISYTWEFTWDREWEFDVDKFFASILKAVSGNVRLNRELQINNLLV